MKNFKKGLVRTMIALFAVTACVGFAATTFTATTDGTQAITAYAGDWWTETAYSSDVYAWDTAEVDANGWTTRVAGSSAWTMGSKEYKGIVDGYTSFVTAAQGDMFNNNELKLEDGKMISFTYNKANDLNQGNPDFTFFLVKEVPYKQNRPMRFDASLGGIPVMLQIRGTTAKLTGYDTASWSGLENNKDHTVNIYIGTGGDDKSWISIDGVKKTFDATRSAYVKREDPTNESSTQLNEWAGWLNIHSEEGCDVKVSKPITTDLVNYNLTLNTSARRMKVGETYTLTAEANFNVPNGYTWTSSDTNVATIENGVVTAVGAGEATITVAAGEASQTCNITVNAFTDPNGWMTAETSSAWSHGILADSYDYEEDTQKTIFSLGDCCDTYNGNALDLTKGAYSITCYYGSADNWAMLSLITEEKFRSATRTSNEGYGPLAIAIKDNQIELWGATGSTTWDVACRTEHTLTFYIGTGAEGDESFIAVDGDVKYVNKTLNDFAVTNGDTTSYVAYIAMFGAKPRSFEIAPITQGSIAVVSETAVELFEGDTATVTATALPASDAAIVWTSENEQVATVANGTITAVKEGTTTIYAEIGGVKTAIAVTVDPIKVTALTLDKEELALNVGGTEKLTATYAPENATVGTTITYKSLNEAVATVDGEGNVTAVAAGTAVIIASCGTEGEFTANCTVTVTEAPKTEEPKDPETPASSDTTSETPATSDTTSEVTSDTTSETPASSDTTAPATSDTTAPATSDTAATSTAATDTATTATSSKSSGCGNTIGLSSIAMVTTLAGAAFALRKKKSDR